MGITKTFLLEVNKHHLPFPYILLRQTYGKTLISDNGVNVKSPARFTGPAIRV